MPRGSKAITTGGDSFSAAHITLAQFNTILSRYDATITSASKPKPEPLTSLDSWRRHELPGLITSRSPPHMEKAEVYRLVDCKLKRGKTRPILRLIDANPPAFVTSTTTTAFAHKDLKSSFTALLALKGVGPATASYLLAAHRCPNIPVFSDEAFRWVVHSGDWNAKIKYDEKEYWEFYGKVKDVAERLSVTLDEVERVGFVLGKEATTTPVAGKARERANKAAGIEEPPSSRKRKIAAEEKPPPAKKPTTTTITTRRSGRLRKQ
ncbi:hypothetical protein FN846DRAFT_904227 [Sphaerosporella brunnea]|uniref:Uncharacterized protein n=1 Tax=Sphaerosporella brunnea TaxID=1250544 RepID=A0A5J5F585_9PEZI|nr:hypothetical protein FN846DRAFT_904227 [Sphaerosporella brunnea]